VKEPLPWEIDEDHVGGLVPEQVDGQVGHAQRTSDDAQELREHKQLDGEPEEVLQTDRKERYCERGLKPRKAVTKRL
jgi:negative regulator of sigma E activity